MDPPQYPLYSLIGAQTNSALQHQSRPQQQQNYSILPPQILANQNQNQNSNQNSNSSDPLINSRTKVVLDNVKLSLVQIEKSFKSLENQVKEIKNGTTSSTSKGGGEEDLNLNLEKGFDSIKEVMKNLMNESTSKSLQSLTTLFESSTSSTSSSSSSSTKILETLKTDSEVLMKGIKSSAESTRNSQRTAINKLGEELKCGIAKLGDKFLIELSALDGKLDGLKDGMKDAKERDLERDEKIQEERKMVERERKRDIEDRELLIEDNEILRDRIDRLESEVRLMSTTITTELSDIKLTLLPLVDLIPTLTKILLSPTPPPSKSSINSTNSSNSNLSVRLNTPTSAQSRSITSSVNYNEETSSDNSLAGRKNRDQGGNRLGSFENNRKDQGGLESIPKSSTSNSSLNVSSSSAIKGKDLILPTSTLPESEVDVVHKSQSQFSNSGKVTPLAQSYIKEFQKSPQVHLQSLKQTGLEEEEEVNKSESRKFSSSTRNDQNPRSIISISLPSLFTSPKKLNTSTSLPSSSKLTIYSQNTSPFTTLNSKKEIVDSALLQFHTMPLITSDTSKVDGNNYQKKSHVENPRKRTLSVETEKLVDVMKIVSIPVTPNATTSNNKVISVIKSVMTSKRQRRTIEQEPSQSSSEETGNINSPSRVGPDVRAGGMQNKKISSIGDTSIVSHDEVVEDEEEVETQDEED